MQKREFSIVQLEVHLKCKMFSRGAAQQMASIARGCGGDSKFRQRIKSDEDKQK